MICDTNKIFDISNDDISKDLNIIISQTNYDKKKAIEQLNRLKDPILVIKEYLNPNYNDNNINNIKNNKSINQQIYSEIRNKFNNKK